MSDEQIYEEFGIEKPADYDAQKSATAQLDKPKQIGTPAKEELEDEPKEDPLEQKQKRSFKNWLRDFFAQALRDDRADHLNW